MSAPISFCEISKAARGDEEAYKSLLMKVLYNLTQPAHTVFGCTCKPSCPEPNDLQRENLNARIAKDIEEHQKKNKL